MTLHLVEPFPPSWVPRLWCWLHECPESNFADDAPTTFAAFATEIEQRQRLERTWGIVVDDEPAGYIGYLPITTRLGSLHGICLAGAVCHRGLGKIALTQALESVWASGVEKVCATFFNDNLAVSAMLRRVGFCEEGLLVDHVVRDGQPVSMRIVAMFKPVPIVLKERVS